VGRHYPERKLTDTKTGSTVYRTDPDLRTRQGLRVEVKPSAYLQTWIQQRPSTISFNIKPAVSWDARTNTYATERKRQSDVYGFCVFTPTDKAIADPLNLGQWDFYVMSTHRLNASVGEQKTITLTSLQRYEPAVCSFVDLSACIDTEAGPVQPSEPGH